MKTNPNQALDALVGQTLLIRTNTGAWFVGRLAWGGKRGFRLVTDTGGRIFRNQWRYLAVLS
jgi:hypothetical protein